MRELATHRRSGWLCIITSTATVEHYEQPDQLIRLIVLLLFAALADWAKIRAGAANQLALLVRQRITFYNAGQQTALSRSVDP